MNLMGRVALHRLFYGFGAPKGQVLIFKSLVYQVTVPPDYIETAQIRLSEVFMAGDNPDMLKIWELPLQECFIHTIT